MDTGINTEALQQARGLRSRSDVAKEVGVTRQQIWQYEAGKTVPSVAVLIKLANLYGVGVEKLIHQKNLAEV